MDVLPQGTSRCPPLVTVPYRWPGSALGMAVRAQRISAITYVPIIGYVSSKDPTARVALTVPMSVLDQLDELGGGEARSVLFTRGARLLIAELRAERLRAAAALLDGSDQPDPGFEVPPPPPATP